MKSIQEAMAMLADLGFDPHHELASAGSEEALVASVQQAAK